MSEQLVSFQDVSIRVPNEALFEGISFELKKGEHWAFVGENEVLKKAMIDALSGSVPVIGGRAEFPFLEKYRSASPHDPYFSHSRYVAKIAERHEFRNLSHTQNFYYQQRFNSSDSEDAQTVHDYLEQVHGYRHLPALDFEGVVDRLNLLPLLNKQLIKLSHGETKRLLIASALLRHPEILLFINPFTGLDTSTRQELQELINQIAAGGITVVLSTKAGEIPEAITHVAVFGNGNTIELGTKEELRQRQKKVQTHSGPDEKEVRLLVAGKAMPFFDKIVDMKNVGIRYGDTVILDNINWTIKQGERWALLGPNGAGKSTLLSLICGDNPQAFANDIILFDRKKGSGESIWDIKQKIGFFSPELYQYFPLDTTCLQAVESGFYDTIGLFRQSSLRLVTACRRWMALLGVEELVNKRLGQVSATQQRLCLLARALVKQPPLLILDEPCQGFNEEQVNNFKGLINAICANSNTTVIYVSHYPSEIPGCVTKSFRLEKGKQIE